jgi:acyl carrier protein
MDCMTRPDVETKVKEAVRNASERKAGVQPAQRLIGDLGFDSLRMVALSLALEDQFDRPLLLNDWLGCSTDVNDLTVGSLAEYVYTVLELHD